MKKDGRLTMCPYACGFRDRADTISNHIHFHCRRRPVKCTKCPVIVKEEVLVEVRKAAPFHPRPGHPSPHLRWQSHKGGALLTSIAFG